MANPELATEKGTQLVLRSLCLFADNIAKSF